MQKKLYLSIFIYLIFIAGCSTGYKTSPASFKMPSTYDNSVNVAGANLAAVIHADPAEAEKAFGFDIIGAKILPVEVIFDNKGSNSLLIDGEQTFLEDQNGNWWPVLSRKIAHERATKNAAVKGGIKEGVNKSLWGAAAGTIIGTAIGIVTGNNVAEALGKGAASGAAAGAIFGGIAGYASNDLERQITDDLLSKSFQNKTIAPKSLSFGFLFFPGETGTARRIRLKIVEENSDNAHIIDLNLLNN